MLRLRLSGGVIRARASGGRTHAMRAGQVGAPMPGGQLKWARPRHAGSSGGHAHMMWAGLLGAPTFGGQAPGRRTPLSRRGGRVAGGRGRCAGRHALPATLAVFPFFQSILLFTLGSSRGWWGMEARQGQTSDLQSMRMAPKGVLGVKQDQKERRRLQDPIQLLRRL